MLCFTHVARTEWSLHSGYNKIMICSCDANTIILMQLTVATGSLCGPISGMPTLSHVQWILYIRNPVTSTYTKPIMAY